ncbi:hypothetical protein PYCCODRAFT_1379001, partial [Trametes coccinea BRFM310]
AVHDVCANCAGPHSTAQCNTADDPHSYRCANCDTAGHAAWDRCCPTLRARVSARAHRKADSGFRFFVTNSPKTWVSEEEELQHAPPPPTVWSQVRHHFDHADSRSQRKSQTTIDAYLKTHEQSATTATQP